jgi:ABC-type branched-subunit amino acid transport system substrate-binding protein
MKPNDSRTVRKLFGHRIAMWGALLSCLSLGFGAGCDSKVEPEVVPENAIRIGAALPFSGPHASTGIHLERAMMMAVEQVNDAGGVNGRLLHLKVRDSNSGSDRGLTELGRLLDDDEVSYLVGPEEDHLALDMVAKVKSHDVLHLLPSFASPTITDSGSRGAWLRLAPSALTIGCALATKAFDDGTETTRTIAARDDYHLELATVFSSALSNLGGRAFPTVTVASGESSYKKAISQVNRYEADATLMLAYPGTAATIIKEMSRGTEVRWYFSPMLRDDALLSNLPAGSIEDAVGVSPSLSSNADCNIESSLGGADGGTTSIRCSADSAARFAAHYAKRWDGTAPIKSAHFYYDAVILLALSLERAAADGADDPSPQELLPYFTHRSEDDETIAWDSLEEGLELAKDRTDVRYVGAAGEYEFNARGQNIRAIVDTWVIDGDHQFADRESAVCRIALEHN